MLFRIACSGVLMLRRDTSGSSPGSSSVKVITCRRAGYIDDMALSTHSTYKPHPQPQIVHLLAIFPSKSGSSLVSLGFLVLALAFLVSVNRNDSLQGAL